MINSTNTIHIDGTIIDHDSIVNPLGDKQADSFTRWVVRPLALLAALGMGVAIFFASAFLIAMSLAMLPLMAVAVWAMKKKLERDMTRADESVSAQSETDQHTGSESVVGA